MKKLLLTVGLVLGFGIGSAHAVPVAINVDELYDWGRVYSFDGVSTHTTVNSLPAYPGSGADTPIGTTVTQGTYGNTNGSEDSWGVGNITSIKSIPPGTTFFQQVPGQELTFMFYGFDDNYINTVGTTTQIKSAGGHISVYLDATPEFDHGISGTAGRTGATSYATATDGILVLDLAPVVFDAEGNTLSSTFDSLLEQGSGNMFLAVTGLGAWDSQYDTNTQLFGSDFSFSLTTRLNGNPLIADWVVTGDAGGTGNATVPEPASMMLLGSGLIGMLKLRKRKA